MYQRMELSELAHSSDKPERHKPYLAPTNPSFTSEVSSNETVVLDEPSNLLANTLPRQQSVESDSPAEASTQSTNQGGHKPETANRNSLTKNKLAYRRYVKY